MFAKGKRKPSGPNRFAALQNSDEDDEDSGSKSIDNNSIKGASAEAAGMDEDFEAVPTHSWVDLLAQDDEEDFIIKEREKEKTDCRKIWTFEPKKDLPKKELSEIWSEESPPRYCRPFDRIDYSSTSNRSLFDTNTNGLEYTMALRAAEASRKAELATIRNERELADLRQQVDTYTGRVDIVWKRVEGLRQAQDLLVTHIEGMKRNSQEQGDVDAQILQLQRAFNRLKMSTDEEQNKLRDEIRRSRAELYRSLMFSSEFDMDFNGNTTASKNDKQQSLDAQSIEKMVDSKVSTSFDKMFERESARIRIKKEIDRTVSDKLEELFENFDTGVVMEVQTQMDTRLVRVIQAVLNNSGSVKQISSVVDAEIARKVEFLLKQPISQSAISKRIGNEIDLYVPHIVHLLLSELNVESKISETIESFVNSNLSSKIREAMDGQYFGINNQIRSEIEKQLSSLSRKILDEPKTDSMIRSKISDEIDSRIQTRISEALQDFDIDGAVKNALEKEIDNILDESLSNAFLEKIIDRRLNRRLAEKIDQMLEIIDTRLNRRLAEKIDQMLEDPRAQRSIRKEIDSKLIAMSNRMIDESKIMGSMLSNRSLEDDSDQGPISQRIFIGRLPDDCAGRDLDDLCGRFGSVLMIEIKVGGFAFVEFEDSRDALRAVRELDGTRFLGCRIRVEVARDCFPPIRGRTPKHGGRIWKEDETWKINVENVSTKTSWQDLKDYFSEFGDVSFVEVHEKRKGEGVVEFTNRKSFQEVLGKRNDLKLHGRILTIFED